VGGSLRRSRATGGELRRSVAGGAVTVARRWEGAGAGGGVDAGHSAESISAPVCVCECCWSVGERGDVMHSCAASLLGEQLA
jgi:hypothetical protein